MTTDGAPQLIRVLYRQFPRDEFVVGRLGMPWPGSMRHQESSVMIGSRDGWPVAGIGLNRGRMPEGLYNNKMQLTAPARLERRS